MSSAPTNPTLNVSLSGTSNIFVAGTTTNTKTVAVSNQGAPGPANLFLSATPPPNPSVNQLWVDTNYTSESAEHASATYATVVNGGNEMIASANAGATLTIDLTQGNVWVITLTSPSCTLTLPGAPPAGRVSAFTLFVNQDSAGGRTITWPSGLKWGNGIAPTLTSTANGLDILSFIRVNNNWVGMVSASAVA